jgi:hypothetical protein
MSTQTLAPSIRAIPVALVLLALVACGGGGGGGGESGGGSGGDTPPPATGSNWDQLIWNQGNWM